MAEGTGQGPVVKPGDIGRNFSLKDQHNKTFDLLENSGKNTILSFHPLAWTAVCAGHMMALEQNFEKFKSLNTVAVGISVDSVPCKKAWAESLKITNTRLISDFWPHGEVARLYGVFREANGFSERTNIVLDKNQKVIFVKIYPVHELPDFTEIFEVLKTVQ
jgi:peroxiredoxin